MIRRYTSPKGGVIFDHPYIAESARRREHVGATAARQYACLATGPDVP
jgi:hypothetical protein